MIVLTFTSGNRPEQLARCEASVKRALRAGLDTHKIVVGDGSPELKWRTLQELDQDEVCFVDDDDYIEYWAVSAVSAGLQTGAGLAFTNEAVIHMDGQVIPQSNKIRSYLELIISPRNAHHLAAVRLSAIHPECLTVAKQYGDIGIDWLIRASAGLREGAIQVPHVGYYWCEHPGQLTKTDWLERHTQAHVHLSVVLRGWARKLMHTKVEVLTNYVPQCK